MSRPEGKLFPLVLLRQVGAWWLRRRLVVEQKRRRGARRRRLSVVKALLWGSVLQNRMWATPRCSILAVGLLSDVATAVHVATSEEASPWSDVTLSRRGGRDSTRLALGVSVASAGVSACARGQVCPYNLLVENAAPDCWFCNLLRGVIRGGTGVCSSLTSWHVQSTGWFHLWALNLVELRAKGCFHVVFDSAGSTGVVSGPTLVVGHGVALFYCFIVLCSRDSLSQEFVAGWLWWRFVASCVASSVFGSVGGGTTFGVLVGVWEVGSLQWWLVFQQGPSVSCRRVLLLLLGARATSVVILFARAAVGFVIGLLIFGMFARAKQMLVCRVAPLVERCDTCLWLLSALCWLVVNSGEVLPEFFSVGFGGKVEEHRLVALCSGDVSQNGLLLSWFSQSSALVVLVEVLSGLACIASIVLRAAVFSLLVCVVGHWVVRSGEGSSQDRPLSFLVEGSSITALGAFGGGSLQSCPVVVLVVAALSLCRDELSLLPVVFLFVFEFLGCAGGTLCVPMVGWFTSLLAPYVLSQMMVWLLGVVVLCHGIWCHVAHRGDLCGEGPSPLSCLEGELVAPLMRVVFLVAQWVMALFRCVFCLCLNCALEALVAIWCVALSAYGGLLWRVLPVSCIVLAVGGTVLHLAEFCVVRHFMSLLGVRGVELSASGTLCVGPYLVASLVDDLLAFSRFAISSGDLYLAASDRGWVVTTEKSWYDLVVPLHLLLFSDR
ncbi:hypothetical protein Taro_012628, partial [Colocasia esculenta]|nr:hypothetical protein [Colocasia esculenta]